MKKKSSGRHSDWQLTKSRLIQAVFNEGLVIPPLPPGHFGRKGSRLGVHPLRELSIEDRVWAKLEHLKRHPEERPLQVSPTNEEWITLRQAGYANPLQAYCRDLRRRLYPHKLGVSQITGRIPVEGKPLNQVKPIVVALEIHRDYWHPKQEGKQQ